MLCHVVSWSGCGWRICCGPFRHGAALSGRRSGVFFRLARFASSAGAFRCPGPAAGAPAQRNPFPRVSRACAREPGCARYAAARIARPIAPARARAKRSAPPSASTSTSTTRPAGGDGAPAPDPADGQDCALPGRRGRAILCNVMFLSWSSCGWRIRCGPFGYGAALPGRGLRGLRPVGPAARLRQGRFVAPVPPPVPHAAEPFSARIARLTAPARARARRGASPSASTSTSMTRPAGGGGAAPAPDPAGGQAGRISPSGPVRPCDPVQCHVVSWSSCGWRIRCGPFRHGAVLSRPGLLSLRPVVPASRLRQGHFVPPAPPPARLGSGTLSRAYRARLIAPARARAKRSAPPSPSTSTSTIRPAGGGGAAPEPDPAGRPDFALRASEAARSRAASYFVMVQLRLAHTLWSFRVWSRPFRPGLRGFRPVVPASRLRQGRFVPPVPPPARPCSGTLFRAYPVRAPDCACAREGEGETRGAGFGLDLDFHDPAGGRRRRRAGARSGRRAGLRAPGRRGPAAGPPGQRNPFPRVSRAAPGRARYAAARFARLIAPARARAKRRAHVSRPFPGGVFSRRRETGGEAAPRTPLPRPCPRVSRISRCQSLAANASGGAGGCLRRKREPPGGSSRAGRRLRPRPRPP